MVAGTQYSEWIPVPSDKSMLISEIEEGKKFQIKTDKKIDSKNDIRWAMVGLKVKYFELSTRYLHAAYCGGSGKVFNDTDLETKGFFLRAGVFTFLKTSTQLQIWFDDVLEVTWVYENKDIKLQCVMWSAMSGLKFQTKFDGKVFTDKVSTHYRYETASKI